MKGPFQKNLAQQVAAVAQEAMGPPNEVGQVESVGLRSINVRLADSGTLYRDVPVVGSLTGLQVGDEVYLMRFSGVQVALNPRWISGGQSVVADSEHSHVAYYTRLETNDLLSQKADAAHGHDATTIYALAGFIGGWEINETEIFNDNAVISGLGHIGFGATPPRVFGSVVGAFLGYEYFAANDAEGNPITPPKPVLSLYADANNYLQWTGAKLLVKAANFTLDGSGNITASNVTLTGNITATSGAIGGFVVGADYLRDLANSFGLASTVSGSDDVRFWAGQSFASRAAAPFVVKESGVIGAGTFSAGASGWQVNAAGHMEVNSLVSRGELRASVFAVEEVHAAGGAIIVRPAGLLYEAVTSV